MGMLKIFVQDEGEVLVPAYCCNRWLQMRIGAGKNEMQRQQTRFAGLSPSVKRRSRSTSYIRLRNRPRVIYAQTRAWRHHTVHGTSTCEASNP